MWERSFVAVSVLIDTSRSRDLDDALAMLPEGSEARGAVAEVASKLRDPRRAVRAQGLAVVAQEVAMAIARVTLR